MSSKQSLILRWRLIVYFLTLHPFRFFFFFHLGFSGRVLAGTDLIIEQWMFCSQQNGIVGPQALSVKDSVLTDVPSDPC